MKIKLMNIDAEQIDGTSKSHLLTLNIQTLSGASSQFLVLDLDEIEDLEDMLLAMQTKIRSYRMKFITPECD